MATYSSILAWDILWTEELGGLQSMGVTKSQSLLSSCCANISLTKVGPKFSKIQE